MNVHDGQLYGLGSAPTYDPSVFAKPRLPPAVAARIFGTNIEDPLAPAAPIFDRATQGAYPTGLDLQADHRAGARSTRAPSG